MTGWQPQFASVTQRGWRRIFAWADYYLVVVPCDWLLDRGVRLPYWLRRLAFPEGGMTVTLYEDRVELIGNRDWTNVDVRVSAVGPDGQNHYYVARGVSFAANTTFVVCK